MDCIDAAFSFLLPDHVFSSICMFLAVSLLTSVDQYSHYSPASTLSAEVKGASSAPGGAEAKDPVPG